MVKFVDGKECLEYETVRKLDLQNGDISLGLQGSSGGWSTHLPISPPKYRKKRKDKDKVVISVIVEVDKITFNITDDYGYDSILIITDDEMKNSIVQKEVKKIKALQESTK